MTHPASARVQIMPELAASHQLFEGLVGRRDHAQVHLQRLGRADGHDLPFLEHAQERGLRLLRQVRDLVEEQGAAVGRAHEAQLVAHGSGERALHVAEELALDERRRDRAAVDRDEGGGPPVALVEPARQHFLARTRLADQDDGNARYGQPRGPFEIVANEGSSVR